MCTFIIFKKEWLKSKKHPIQLLLTFLLPIIATCLVLLFSNQMKPSMHLGVINESTSSNLTEYLENIASQTSGITVNTTQEDSLYSDLMTSKYAAIIKIHDEHTFEVFSLDAALKDYLNTFLNTSEASSSNQNLEIPAADSLSAASRSMSFIFLVMLITATLFAVSIHQEKMDGLLIRYGLAPHHTLAYATGFFLFNLVITLLQVVITAGFISIFNLPLGMPLQSFLLIGSLISMSSSSLAFLVVGLTSNELSASTLSSSIGLLLSLLGGAFLPLAKMPQGFQFMSQFTFTKWLIEATDLFTTTTSLSTSYTSLFGMILFSLVILILGFLLNIKKLSSYLNTSTKKEVWAKQI